MICSSQYLQVTGGCALAGRWQAYALPPQPEEREPPGSSEPHVLAIERLRDILREDGHRLAVYLIPEKLTVYRDLLRAPVPDGDVGARVLAEFEREIRALGIPTVNLEPVLHGCGRGVRQGRADLLAGRYSLESAGNRDRCPRDQPGGRPARFLRPIGGERPRRGGYHAMLSRPCPRWFFARIVLTTRPSCPKNL